MKRVVIINQSANYLMADIADVFLESGKYEKVALLVGNPNSMKSIVQDNVVVDTICPYSRVSMKSRLISWVRGFFDIVRLVRKKYSDYDLFLVSNPATVAFLNFFLKNQYSSLTYDLYPDGFLSSGKITQNSIIFKIWSKVNKRFFGKAKGVFCITEGMADAMSKYHPRNDIHVVQLWGNDRIPVVNVGKESNKFLMENNLVGKFIISYSGNMGQGHDLMTLVEALDQLRDLSELRIIFIGEGYLKTHLMERVKQLKLENLCLFFPYQPIEMLPYSFSCPDISVVSIHRQSVSMPSKTFDIVRMGKPVIGIAEPTSSLSKFIVSNKIGEVFSYMDSMKIASFIRRAYNDHEYLQQYSINSLACSEIYTKQQAKQFLVD